MARAVWNGVVLAESDRPIELEGNVYFPPESVHAEQLSLCPWKGVARLVNKNAAWYYPHPSPLARKIKNHVAFWGGVRVEP